ncbi:MAG: glycosyl hydrolase family 28-related protein [Cyanobacteria bacterium J06635_15]
MLPEDPDIAINIQDFGASGDGRKDDTDAIQSAIYEAARKNKALYFPNGIYRITREIRFEQPNGRALFIAPHIYGQSIDGVVLKLDDYAIGFSDADQPNQAVLRTVHADDGTTWKDISADFFNRFIVNLTIDTGDNPGAVGIKFHSNNTGILQNVRIIGNGAIGLDVSSVDLNGPHLIQNLEIEGFAIGVKASGANSTTISNLAIRDASAYGLHHSTGVLQAEGLTVENAPVAVYSRPAQRSNKTTLTLINGRLEGKSSQPAIINGGVLFARNIRTSGYKQALKSLAGKTSKITADNITEYSSHGVDRAFTDNIGYSTNLPIRYLPTQYDPDPDNWLSVKDFGAGPNDKVDDTKAIQAAVDAAAKLGKTTLYFPGGTPPKPSWYLMDGEVTLHGSLQHVIGFAPARILGKGQFTIKDDPAAPDFIQFQGFNFTKIGYENASSRTVLMQNLTGRIIASGPGSLYLNSIATGQLSIDHPEARIWARQLNTEKPANSPENISNDGGFLWILGHKTEQGGIKARTFNGGYTEVLGAYIYSVGRFGQFETIYEVVDAHAAFAGIRERTGNHRFRYFFKETQADESHLYDSLPAGNRFNRAASLYSASQKAFCPSEE